LHVLQAGQVERAEHDDQVGLVDGRDHAGGERRRRVDHDDVVRGAGEVEDGGDVLGRDRVGLVGPYRREQDVHAVPGARGEPAQTLGVHRAAGRGQVVDRVLRLDAENDADVAELQVEVDQQRLAAAG